jgi:hypothetical protein
LGEALGIAFGVIIRHVQLGARAALSALELYKQIFTHTIHLLFISFYMMFFNVFMWDSIGCSV